MDTITQEERDIFEQIFAAIEEQDPDNCVGLCLLKTKHIKEGKDVAIICRSSIVDESVNFYPLARIIVPEEIGEYEQPNPIAHNPDSGERATDTPAE